MTTTTNFKDMLDLPMWKTVANAPTVFSAGISLAFDLRNNIDQNPFIYQLAANAVFSAYHVMNDDWMTLVTPALTGTFGAGAGCIFCPSQGPSGTLAAGCTTTVLNLTTALPAAVGLNQLANRGDGRGFKIRIIRNAAASGGTTEEKYIVNNTSGTTPQLTLDSALGSAPASGDRYEFLSGRVFLLGAGVLAAGMWKYYDVLTNSYSGNLATTNLPATISTESALLSLDELHVPADRAPGEGFFGNLTATGSSSTTLTGPASGGDTVVSVNEYRNFQIRIVTDVTTPTAAGQRRRITSHTVGGTNVVYTVPAWTVTPSTNATYVIENDTDKILLWSSASANTHCYNITANTWDTTTFAVRPAVMAGGCWAEQGFGVILSANRLAQHSYIYSARGGAVSTIDLFDISGGATGVWTGAITYGGAGPTFGGGTAVAYAPATENGRYVYINQTSTQRNLRFDMHRRVLEPYCYLRYVQGAAVIGGRMASSVFVDGATKISFIYQGRATGAELFNLLVSR